MTEEVREIEATSEDEAQTLPDGLTMEQLDDIWASQNAEREDMKKRQDYYDGDHKIVGQDETNADGSKKGELVSNWMAYIVNRFVGSMTDKPYSVTLAEDNAPTEALDAYRAILKDNAITSQDTENLRMMLTMGPAVEVHGFSEDKEITITSNDPRNWAIVYNSDGVLTLAMKRIVLPANTFHDGKLLEAQLILMTVYTVNAIFDYQQDGAEGGWLWTRTVQHNYGQVPIVDWRANADGKTILTDALIGQQDEYNDVDSGSGDSLKYNSDALLILFGLDPEWVKQHAVELKETRIVSLPSDGDIKFILKATDVTAINARLDRTREHIHMMGEVPDVETIVGATGSTSGIALALKFLPMAQRAAGMANWIAAGVRERINLINVIQKALGKPPVENYDVKITFSLPRNRTEEWTSISKLDGEVSHKTRLVMLSDVDDPEAELARIAEENAQARGTGFTDPDGEASEVRIEQTAEDIKPLIEATIKTIADAATSQVIESGAIEKLAAAREKAGVPV